MAHKKTPRLRKAGIWLTVLICAYEAFTKGWISLLLLPASLVVLPLYVVLQFMAIRSGHGPYGRPVTVAATLVTVCMLGLYVSVVGFGDTDEVFLFGFYPADSNALLTRISTGVSLVALYATPAAMLALIGLLVANRKHKSER